MEKYKIIKNAVQCLKCKDIIESKYRHDYVTCSCGNVSVDGGTDYLRRCFKEQGTWVDCSISERIQEGDDKNDKTLPNV